MYFEEDPFDRWCRLLVAFMVMMVHMAELVVWDLARCLKVQVGYRLAIVWLRACFLGKKYIGLLLVLYGLKEAPTWTEVEAYRLQVIAKIGRDIPRSPDLEEGLRQEQAQQE